MTWVIVFGSAGPTRSLFMRKQSKELLDAVAAGGRAAMLATGNLVTDGVAWEEQASVRSPR